MKSKGAVKQGYEQLLWVHNFGKRSEINIIWIKHQLEGNQTKTNISDSLYDNLPLHL